MAPAPQWDGRQQWSAHCPGHSRALTSATPGEVSAGLMCMTDVVHPPTARSSAGVELARGPGALSGLCPSDRSKRENSLRIALASEQLFGRDLAAPPEAAFRNRNE